MLRSYGALIGGLLLFILWGTARVLGWLDEPFDPAFLSLFGLSFKLPLPVQLGCGATLVLLDAWLVFRIVNENVMFRKRNYLSQGLFLVLMAGTPFVLSLISALVCLTLTLLAVLILLNTFGQQRAVGAYCTSFMLIGLSVVLIPQWIYLLPFLLIGCASIRTLNMRTFLAAMLGFVVPFWIGAGLLFLSDGIGNFLISFNEIVHLSPISCRHLSPTQWPVFLLILLLALPALFHYPSTTYQLKERSRIAYALFITLFVGALLLACLQPPMTGKLFPLLACISCILVTQMVLTLRERRGRVYRIALIILLLLYMTCSQWMPLLTS